MDNLWEKMNYHRKDKKLYLDTNVYEYDLTKANISSLYCSGLISEDEYRVFLSMDKNSREILIGKKIAYEQKWYKRSKTYEAIKNSIIKSKEELFKTNNIDPNNVIRIANDAVYVEEQMEYRNLEFDIYNNNRYMRFHTNHYSTVLFLDNFNVIIFFRILDDGNYLVEVKGVNDESLEYNSKFLEFICDILMYLQRSDAKTALMKYQEFHNKYINKELPVEYYMEFHNTQAYRINQGIDHIFTFGMTAKSNSITLDNIDIEYNYKILRELYAIIIEKTQ